MILYEARRSLWSLPRFALLVAFSCIVAHLAAAEDSAELSAEAEKVPVLSECRWSEWSSWTGCSGSCGEPGEKGRHRVVETHTSGGSRCDRAASSEWASCRGFCAKARGEEQDGVLEGAPTVKDVTGAAMMFGCIIFMICLFYLVNHGDDDIKRYAWQVISKTLSIFLAVLIYSGADAIIQKLLLFLTVARHPLGLSLIELCVFFIISHMVLRTMSKNKVLAKRTGSSKEVEDASLSLSCAKMLQSHLTGFAAIFAGVRLCKDLGEIAPVLSLLGVLIEAIIFHGIFLLSDLVRNHTATTNSSQQEVIELWEEVSEDSENDSAALALSFILAKFIVDSTVKPIDARTEGRKGREIQLKVDHSRDTETLSRALSCSLAFAVMTVFSVYIGGRCGLRKFHSEPGKATIKQWLARWFFISQSVCAMSCAWLLADVVRWQIARSARSFGIPFDPFGVPERVVDALTISLLAVTFIFALDYLEDLSETPELVDRCIRSIIMSMGIMIGFSWESAFDRGMEVIVDLSQSGGADYPLLIKLLLGLIVISIVMPAWGWYIQKNSMDLERVAEEQEHAYVPCTTSVVEEATDGLVPSYSPRVLTSHKKMLSRC